MLLCSFKGISTCLMESRNRGKVGRFLGTHALIGNLSATPLRRSCFTLSAVERIAVESSARQDSMRNRSVSSVRYVL